MKHKKIALLGLLLAHCSTLPLSETFLTNAEKGARTIEGLPIEPYPIKFSGYVKAESYWDTRQVVGSAVDQYLLYPLPKNLDPLNKDINAKGEFEMVAIQTRLRIAMDGPKIKKASSLGVVEGDFFAKGIQLFSVGSTEVTNIFRMRHAFLQLTWENSCALIAGQAWHPMYVPGADPRTISFNTGDPMDTFARSPQIRFIYNATKNIDLLFTAYSQLDYISDGPIGASSTYTRNAIVPLLDAQIQFKFGEQPKHWIGASAGFMRLIPRLETNLGFKAHESINSYSAIMFYVINWENFSMRNKILYLQNGSDIEYVGGYAVHSVDPVTDNRTYTNIAGTGFWTDWDLFPNRSLIPGMFFGFVKNLGAKESIIQNKLNVGTNVLETTVYGLGNNIDYVLRFSPRTRWLIRNLEVSGELEFTRAAYGTINNTGQVVCTDPTNNVRFLFAMFYYF